MSAGCYSVFFGATKTYPFYNPLLFSFHSKVEAGKSSYKCSMEIESTSSETHWSPELQNKWIQIQDSLKNRLKTEDDFNWKIPAKEIQDLEEKSENLETDGDILKYVGGVDLSYSKTDPSIACATVVVFNLNTLQTVYEDSSIVELHIPYVPGILAFREAPVLLELLQKVNKSLPFYPQVLMVDGNGLLHPRGFGLACHLGVLANLPTVGIGKNLHHVDGLTQSRERQLLEAEGNLSKDVFNLVGESGSTLGTAMRSTQDALKPIFISVGHRISLASAIKIVKMCCRFRVPEPIRQADIRSKACLRKNG